MMRSGKGGRQAGKQAGKQASKQGMQAGKLVDRPALGSESLH